MHRHANAIIALMLLLVAAATAAARLPDNIQPIHETITTPTVGADVAMVGVTGIPSMDLIGSPNNIVIFLWIGPFNSITGIGWDVVLQTLVPESRRRDITMNARNTQDLQFSGFFIQPGSIDPTPGGPTAYDSGGILKLADFNIPHLQALADGLIRLEFSESRENAPGEADAIWVSGTVSLQTRLAIPPVPPPATVALLATAGLAYRRRRDHAGLTMRSL